MLLCNRLEKEPDGNIVTREGISLEDDLKSSFLFNCPRFVCEVPRLVPAMELQPEVKIGGRLIDFMVSMSLQAGLPLAKRLSVGLA